MLSKNPLETRDTAIKTALELDGKELWNLCFTNKSLMEWINNSYFWNLKISKDFGFNLFKILERNATLADYKYL